MKHAETASFAHKPTLFVYAGLRHATCWTAASEADLCGLRWTFIQLAQKHPPLPMALSFLLLPDISPAVPPGPSRGRRADRGARRPVGGAKTGRPAPQRGPGHAPHAPKPHVTHATHAPHATLAPAPKALPREAQLLATAAGARACARPGPRGPARPGRRLEAAAPGTAPRRSPGCGHKAPSSGPARGSARWRLERPPQAARPPARGGPPGRRAAAPAQGIRRRPAAPARARAPALAGLRPPSPAFTQFSTERNCIRSRPPCAHVVKAIVTQDHAGCNFAAIPAFTVTGLTGGPCESPDDAGCSQFHDCAARTTHKYVKLKQATKIFATKLGFIGQDSAHALATIKQQRQAV